MQNKLFVSKQGIPKKEEGCPPFGKNLHIIKNTVFCRHGQLDLSKVSDSIFGVGRIYLGGPFKNVSRLNFRGLVNFKGFNPCLSTLHTAHCSKWFNKMWYIAVIYISVYGSLTVPYEEWPQPWFKSKIWNGEIPVPESLKSWSVPKSAGAQHFGDSPDSQSRLAIKSVRPSFRHFLLFILKWIRVNLSAQLQGCSWSRWHY